MLKWYAYHIFYFDDPTLLLRQIYSILKKAQIKYGNFDYFFIRYWNGGPHLRLRIKAGSVVVPQFVACEINDLLKRYPSKVILNKKLYLKTEKKISVKEGETLIPIQNNNTVLQTRYCPEYDKYFGVKGVESAEKEFVFSSRLVLKIIAMNNSKSINYLISVAFFDLLFSAARIEFNKSNFILNYNNYWKEFTSGSKHFSKIEHVQFSKKAIERTQLIVFSNEVFLFHQKIFDEIKKEITNKNEILNFVFNFYHLFNNRLGITPVEEVVVSRIAYNSLIPKKERRNK